jgi:hypothetical protein
VSRHRVATESPTMLREITPARSVNGMATLCSLDPGYGIQFH